MTERWLPIPDWPIYEASDEGRVRSIPRFTRAKAGSVMRRRGVTLKQRPDRDGYPTVGLLNVSLDLKKTRKVATLVALTFLGPRPVGMEVCHNDGDRNNSRLSNLRYDTPSANQLDKTKHGTNPNVAKTHCPQGHPYDENNTVIDGGSRKCRTCRSARAAMRQRDKTFEGTEPRQHGTLHAYRKYKCRCDLCRAAKRQSNRKTYEGRQRRKAA